MNDEEFERQKERIQALREKWVGPLGLKWWCTNWKYDRGDIADSDGYGNYPVAHCRADWRYLEATIEWSLPRVVNLSDQELENVLVHELMHIFVNEMREGKLKHEERVCETLARAFVWLRDDCKERYGSPDTDAE